jgi:hypothetical protein
MGIREIAKRKAEASSQAKAAGDQIKGSLSRSRPREDERWSFGFSFFKEIKHFGLDSTLIDRKWPLAMLYRLSEMSRLTVASVMEGAGQRDGTLRIHEIDWNGKNVPIVRKDFDWLDADYLNNAEEFPIFQLSISRAEGRLVGFLDEANVYQIILLDPLHNAQPTKYHDYKVRLSQPLGCEITSIKHKASVVSARSKEHGCDCWRGIDEAFAWNKRTPGVALVMPMKDDQALADADDLIGEGHVDTYADIFAEGLNAVLTRATRIAPVATTVAGPAVATPSAPVAGHPQGKGHA